VAAQEGRQASFAEPGGAVGCRVALTEGERDLRVEPSEDRFGARPVLVQQRRELVGSGDPCGELVVTQPHERLQLAGLAVKRLESPQPLSVGAQVVGEPVRVAGVGLRGCSLPARTRGGKRIRVNWHDRMTGRQQPLDQQAARPLDRHRQLAGRGQPCQPRQCVMQALLAVREPKTLDDRAMVVDDAKLVCPAGPVHPDEHPITSVIDDTVLGAEGLSRLLIHGPSTRLVPNAGRGPSARWGRRDSSWLSRSKRNWPSPSSHREHRRTVTGGTDGMVTE